MPYCDAGGDFVHIEGMRNTIRTYVIRNQNPASRDELTSTAARRFRVPRSKKRKDAHSTSSHEDLERNGQQEVGCTIFANGQGSLPG